MRNLLLTAPVCAWPILKYDLTVWKTYPSPNPPGIFEYRLEMLEP